MQIFINILMVITKVLYKREKEKLKNKGDLFEFIFFFSSFSFYRLVYMVFCIALFTRRYIMSNKHSYKQ